MADRQYYSMPHMRNDPLPAGWEMRYDNISGWPYFIDHNSKNTTWSDPRLSMNQNPYPNYRPGGPDGRTVEIPVKIEGWQDPQLQQQGQYQQPYSQGNSANYSFPYQNTGAHPQSNSSQSEPGNQQSHSAPAPRRRGDVWEIPIQYVGQNSPSPPSNHGPNLAYQHQAPYQQTPPLVYPQYPPASSADYGASRQPGGGYTDNPPRGLVTIPIIRESCPSPNPARASPNPMTGMQGSPRASPKPDFSQAIPQSARQAQFQNHRQQEPVNHRQQEPVPDYTEPEPGPSAPLDPSQPIPAPAPPPHQEEQPYQPPPPPPPQVQKSPEERAFEIINSIMSEVKSLEEQVNNFRGVKKDKDYRYIEEMLTRSLLKLDTVESGSNENVRQARKQAVRYIEAAIDLLELKAVASEANYNTGSGSDFNPGPSEANTNNSTFNKNPRPANNGHTGATSSGISGGQESSGKDISRVKEMQLDSEIPC